MARRIPLRASRTSRLVGLVASLLASCGDAPPRAAGTAAAPATTAAGAAASTAASASPRASAAPRRRHAQGARAREGETSVEALFDRAREALAAGDDLGLVRCLDPEARRTWLTDALLAIEVEAQDPRYQDDLARRRAVGALRDRVVSHLADRRPGDRPPSLGAAEVGAALLARVDDADVLLAELLAVSRSLGHPLDPVGAVDRGRLGGRPLRDAGPPRPPPAGLPRALRRIERARDLAEVHLDEGQGIALVRAPDGGLEPIRIVRRGDTLWIDES